MNKKISLGVAIAFMAVVASITFCLTMLFSQGIFNDLISSINSRGDMYDKMEEVNKTIRNNFLFPVDDEQLTDSLARGLLTGLEDPYAEYLTKEAYEQDSLERKGELVGIGIQVKYDAASKYLIVTNVYADSPAQAQGIQKDDVIIQIDEVNMTEITYQEAVGLIKGEVGTRVSLLVLREGEELSFDMQRKNVDIPGIESRMIGENAYIKITDFNGATPAYFQKAVEDAIDEGATGLIFDLRNNSGGTMNAVTEMLDLLLPKGVIVTQTDNKGETEVVAESDANEINLPMVTLTNVNTASAAELFVAALKDYEKALSVGTTTYGKGVMQTTFPLSDGSAVRLTTAYFNPPKSENFNGVGIVPDHEVLLTPELEQELDSLDETTDLQLSKAIEVVNTQKTS